MEDNLFSVIFMCFFMVVYFCVGFGYVVSVIFIVVIIN